jgi:hypothetical protein
LVAEEENQEDSGGCERGREKRERERERERGEAGKLEMLRLL